MKTPNLRSTALLALLFAGALQAQTLTQMQNTNPRVTTPTTTTTPSSTTSTAPATTSTSATSSTTAPTTSAPVPTTTTSTTTPLTPVPAPPASTGPVVFGSQMFTGRFAATTFSGFNPDYQVSIGDRVTVRMWGAVLYEATQAVDAQGNLFIPNVGPIRVANVRNGELNAQVEAQIKKVFRSNVGVYATLDAAQPVKVFVTGFVRAPGLYAGLSSDAVLYFLDKAGGIDPDRGSFLSVDVLRGGKARAKVDLYRFLLDGQIETLQFQDGDTIVVGSRRNTISVAGEVLNPYLFEFPRATVPAEDVLKLALPKSSATHMSIVRKVGSQRRSDYYPISELANVQVNGGDEVTFTADKYPGTILVRIEGANLSERSMVLPYGAKLQDVIDRLKPAPQANVDGLQLFRTSVAAKQKEQLDVTIRGLETAALSARSSTTEEASLRRTEADLILQFIDRVRNIMPKGQVVLNDRAQAASLLLEDGDVIVVPEKTNTVSVSGEVTFPNTLIFSPDSYVEKYIDLVGGFTQRADRSKIIVLRPNGTVGDPDEPPAPGDQIIVMPKVETKWVELARGLTSILYQLAISASVLSEF